MGTKGLAYAKPFVNWETFFLEELSLSTTVLETNVHPAATIDLDRLSPPLGKFSSFWVQEWVKRAWHMPSPFLFLLYEHTDL